MRLEISSFCLRLKVLAILRLLEKFLADLYDIPTSLAVNAAIVWLHISSEEILDVCEQNRSMTNNNNLQQGTNRIHSSWNMLHKINIRVLGIMFLSWRAFVHESCLANVN